MGSPGLESLSFSSLLLWPLPVFSELSPDPSQYPTLFLLQAQIHPWLQSAPARSSGKRVVPPGRHDFGAPYFACTPYCLKPSLLLQAGGLGSCLSTAGLAFLGPTCRCIIPRFLLTSLVHLPCSSNVAMAEGRPMDKGEPSRRNYRFGGQRLGGICQSGGVGTGNNQFCLAAAQALGRHHPGRPRCGDTIVPGVPGGPHSAVQISRMSVGGCHCFWVSA